MPSLPQVLHTASYRVHWRTLLALLSLAVGALALAPAQQMPSLGYGDKFNHLMAFASLALTAAFSLRAGLRRTALAAAGLLGYGGAIELLQSLVPGRHADWADLVVDGAGIVLGLLLAASLRRIWPSTGR